MNDTNNNELNIENLSGLRQRQNLSIADVANSIKVNSELIKNIEAGEFNKIGAPTFIKGHVSNYARAIGIDPQQILDLIPSEQLNGHQIRLSGSKVSSPLSRVKTRSSGFGKYVFGTFLVSALALSFYFVYDKWDQQKDINNQLVASETNEAPLKKNNNEKRVIYSSLLPQAEISNGETKSNNDVKTSDDGMAEDTVSAETESDSTEGLNETESTIADVNDNDDPNAQSNEEPDNRETVAATENDLLVAAEAKYKINLDLTEQAWVSIEGEDGEKVLADLMAPGSHNFSANQAIKFRIGNASKVKLTINNQVVDLAPETQGNVAKLSWPQSG